MGADADTAFGTVDSAIGHLVGEKQGLTARIVELTSLISESTVVPPAPSAPQVQAAPEAPAPQPVQAAPPAQAHAPQPPPAQSAPATDTPATHAAAEVPASVEPAVEPKPAPAVASAPPAAPAKPEVPPAAASGAPPAANGAVPAAPPAQVPRQSFDELAFLSAVVGKNDAGARGPRKEPAPVAPKSDGPLVERRSTEPLLKAPVGIVQEENAGESLLAGVENARLETGEHPLAANVPSNTPIVLRPSTTLEQAKTLKCNECGGMNYPTEWYCERCGAELAAL
jgi:hypothetical protein